jgi:NAD(P)H-flavin reductase/ferredoxin
MLGLSRKPTTPCRINVSGSDCTFEVAKNKVLLASALNQGVAYPHNCKVGTCGSCKTRLVSGRVRPLLDFALSTLTAEDLKGGYILACQAKVLSDLELEVPIARHGATLQTVGAVVESCEAVAPDVIDLRLRLDSPFSFQPGQWASIGAADSAVRRAYSFHTPAGDGGGSDAVGFYIKKLPGGAFSEWLFESDRTGVRFEVHGPFGALGDADPAGDNICVAGSTGLAPVLSVIEAGLEASDTSRWTLVFGVRRAEDLFAMDRLERLHQRWGDRLRVVPILSHEPQGSDWQGRRGFVTDALEDDLGVDVETANAFLCGSGPMVDACERRLLSLGASQDRIMADRFMATGASR